MLSIVVDKSDFSDARVSSQITSQNAQLRTPLSSLQTAWTSLNPYLFIYLAVGHPQQIPLW